MDPSTKKRTQSARPTIETIAEEAGVSISTVSRALRNLPLISEKTGVRVRKIAARIGYQPNPYVSALMSHLRTTRPIPYQATIAVIDTFPDPREWRQFSVQRQFQAGALERAGQLGYQLERFWAGQGTEKKALTRVLLSRGIRGVLVPPLRDYSTNGLDIPVEHPEFACVTVGCKVVNPGFHFATNDQYVTGQLVHEKLLELGYMRVGMAIPSYVECIVEQRFSAGFRNAVDRLGKRLHRQAVLRYDPKNGKKEFLRWFQAFQPDAICATFPIVREWLEEIGVAVPRDVALAMLDLDENTLGWSGIDQKHALVGAAAADLLVQLLQRNEVSVPQNPFGLTIEGSWVSGATAVRKAPPK